jgi:hypothetical protein
MYDVLEGFTWDTEKVWHLILLRWIELCLSSTQSMLYVNI